MTKKIKPIFNYKLKHFDHVVTAAWQSSRRQRKLARVIFIERFNENYYNLLIRDAVKGGMPHFFEVYPEPQPDVLAYVQQLAYIVDMEKEKARELIEDRDEGLRTIAAEMAQPVARKLLREWYEEGQNFVKGSEPPNTQGVLRDATQMLVMPSEAEIIKEAIDTIQKDGYNVD